MILLDELQATLNSFPKANRYWVAFSGGCDSHVLLHVLSSLFKSKTEINSSNFNIAAVHVHHGLQDSADDWSVHCEQICVDLDIEYILLKVNATAKSGQSPEAVAREARYKAIADFIPEEDVLLVAHHQDDQAETLLLQLIRGAGPRGLSAMPKMKLLGDNRVLRPFLNISQQVILDYAKKHDLHWIDDPSNTDIRYDRNRIRHEILPVLQQRWPSVSKTLARVSQHQAEVVECLLELAEADLQQTLEDKSQRGLAISKLQNLSIARQKNLLRYWIEQLNGFDAINSAHLNRILNEVIPAANDSQPLVQWQNTKVCRYRGVLHVLSASHNKELLTAQNWQISEALELSNLRLISKESLGQGIKQSLITDGTVNIRYRQGGERCQPRGRSNHHSLKKLFQEWAVPPWLRSQIPLIYIGDELVQIVGYCLCEPSIAGPKEQGIIIESEYL